MLTYDLSGRKDLSLYEYLYQKIKQDILAGHLKAEEKLPSKRKLADHLGISVITVENAYSQLIVEGYIYTVAKKGYFISPLEEGNRYAASAPGAEVALKHSENRETKFPYDFHSNSIHAGNFPFSVWSRLMRQVLAEQDKELLRKSPCNGAFVLRQAIAEHLYQFRGMHVLPEQILIGAGTEYLYSLLIQLLGRENVFAVENPGYRKISKIYEQNQAACVYIPLDDKGLSVAELRKSSADIVHISPAHHFPTGIVMPIRRRQELLAWANEKKSRYIIEDDYDSEFRFLGKPVQTLQSIDTGGRVIYINTFSKSIAPSIRISYMVLPLPLLEYYYDKMGFYSCTVSNFEQYTLAKFISGGYFEKHISRMKNYYRKQRDYMISAIRQSPLQKSAQIQEKNAGLHFLLKLHTALTDEEIVRAAEKKGIKISCLSEYYNKQDIPLQGLPEESTLVLNYSGIEYEKIPEAIRLLSEAVL